ncbi:MAG: hypothetical protein M1831_000555 [Alyxoria varia]|nr:MAG: hypothetical protein M1831_000555 [Alyxoria varia]
MAVAQAANLVEKAIGHGDNATIVQDVSNPAKDRSKFGHPTETMKALCWMGKNKVQIQETPKPVVVQDRDVVIKTTGSTVCGSDLHLLHGAVVQMEKGDILGHEFCGVVESVGSGVTNLQPGQRVVASFQIACGDCHYCKQKLSSQCNRTNANSLENGMYGGTTAGMFGYAHFTGGFAGGQAEYVRVPYGDANLLKLPDNVPDEQGLYLSDVLCTSWHCVVDTGVSQGSVVAIWGAGPIGQMCADFSFMHGASRVIMIDNVAWRLDLCKSKDSRVETVNFSEVEQKGGTVTSKLKELTDGLGPDVALECVAGEYAKSITHKVELATGAETDTSEILNEMITSVKSFGRVGVTGIYVGYTNHFNIGALMERGIRLIGNGQAPVHKYWEELLKLIQEGKIDPSRMLSHRVRLEDLETVYSKFEKREDGMQKVFVETKWSAEPAQGSPSLTKLWDVLGDGEVMPIATLSARHLEKTGRPFRIAVDEAGWRFNNLTPWQVAKIREKEPAANPIEKAILWRILRLARLNIQLIFVFDGPSRPWKRNRNAGRIEWDKIKLLHDTLDMLKVPFHRAPAEAEAECALMQKEGIVDAVWSDDGDTLMFGAEILIRDWKLDGKKDDSHVQVFTSESLQQKFSLDRKGLVQFAILSGGDYNTKGLPGCGPQRALQAARAGLGAKLHDAKSESELMTWRDSFNDVFKGKTCVPLEFPRLRDLQHYRDPKVSTLGQVHNLRRLIWGWDVSINETKLRIFLRERYNFWTKGWMKHIAPLLLARSLRQTNSAQKSRTNLFDIKIHPRKGKKAAGTTPPANVKISFSPTAVTSIDISSQPAEEDWSLLKTKDCPDYHPTQRVECDMLECLVRRSVPEDLLDIAALTDRKEKRGEKRAREDHPDFDSETAKSAPPRSSKIQKRKGKANPRSTQAARQPTATQREPIRFLDLTGDPDSESDSAKENQDPNPITMPSLRQSEVPLRPNHNEDRDGNSLFVPEELGSAALYVQSKQNRSTPPAPYYSAPPAEPPPHHPQGYLGPAYQTPLPTNGNHSPSQPLTPPQQQRQKHQQRPHRQTASAPIRPASANPASANHSTDPRQDASSEGSQQKQNRLTTSSPLPPAPLIELLSDRSPPSRRQDSGKQALRQSKDYPRETPGLREARRQFSEKRFEIVDLTDS